jgi:hypothetical protein
MSQSTEMAQWVTIAAAVTGSLTGGFFALMGTFLSNWLQERREQRRLAAEHEGKRLAELRTAYAQLFGTLIQVDAELRDVANSQAGGGMTRSDWASPFPPSSVALRRRSTQLR